MTTDEKFQSESSPSSDASLRRKQESDSIVRGILNSSIKYNHDKQAGLFFKKIISLDCFYLKVIHHQHL